MKYEIRSSFITTDPGNFTKYQQFRRDLSPLYRGGDTKYIIETPQKGNNVMMKHLVYLRKAVFWCLLLCCCAATNTDTTFVISEEGRASFNCSGYFAGNSTAAAAAAGGKDWEGEHDPICKALNDERTFPETYYTSVLGCIIASASAVISTICSILLMIIIHRSSIGLSTVSHRLVFAMSIVDILTSVAMGTTTLPMPKNMVYEFDSSSFGNEFTCNVQGLLVMFGTFAAIFLNTCLAIYYVLSITYKISDATIQKVIEPMFYILCILSTFPMAVSFWVNKLFNPTPYEPWCGPVSYPWYCKAEYEDVSECSIRGIPSTYKIASRTFHTCLFLLGTLIILYCMVSIIRTVYQMEKNLKLMIRIYEVRGIAKISEEEMEFTRSKRIHSHTKMMVMQAVAYTLAAVVANAANISHLGENDPHHPHLELSKKGMTLQIVHAMVRPSQGLFNFIVFLGQKAYDRRRMNESLTWKQAVKIVLFDQEYPHYIMSDMDMLHQDDRRRQQIEDEEDRREDYSEHENEYENADDGDANANNDTPAGVCGLELPAVIQKIIVPPFRPAAFNMSCATNEYDDQNESRGRFSYDPSSRNSCSLDAFDSFLDDSNLSSMGTESSRARSTSASKSG